MAFSIETERLSLRLRGAEDAACNLALLREHEGGTTASVDDVRAELVRQRGVALATGIGLLSIRRRGEGDRIGYCGLIVGRTGFDEPEIAYELLPRAQGSGYATEAARAVADAAFATGRRRIWATVAVWNIASLRVLDQIGFRHDHRVAGARGELIYLVRDAD